MSGHITSPSKSQRGQAAVFVLLFTTILLVSAFALFKAGKITTNKMQLQNAADAAAFSMSTVEARDLNFAAYMNRAIVANEVAIGQLVGLASWAFHFRSFADYMDSYDKLLLSPATLTASTPVVTAITTPWKAAGTTAVNLLSKIAKFGTLVIHNINKIYGFAEFGYHTVSVIFAVGVLSDVIDENGPAGTKISDFGIISLIAHIATYGVLPNLPGEQFATGYMSSKKIDVDEFGNQDSGYARLAALIRDSRDPFTMARGWELRPPGFPIDVSTPDSAPFHVDLGVVGWEADITFHMDLSLERKGASELRILLPSSGKVKAATYANWSSADTTGLFFELGGSGYIKVYVLPEPFRTTVFEGGLSINIANSELVVQASFGEPLSADPAECESANDDITADNDADDDTSNDQELVDCSASAGSGIEILRMPFPTAAPFGSGFAEVGKNTPNNLDPLKHMLLASLSGTIETEHYGEAANNLLAWISPGPGVPTPVGIQFASGEPWETTFGTRVNKKYAGLPFYVDTTGKGPFLGVGAPNLLIGLVQDESDYDSTTVSEPEGRLRLNEAFADEELAVLSKSELYFSRPTDSFASHFHRGDGQIEIGSGFNPFWQARLVDTTYADRTLGLAIQQKQDFINLSNSFDSLLNKLSSILPF